MFSSPGREHKAARGPSHGCDIMREPRNEEISPSSKGQTGVGGLVGGCRKGSGGAAACAAPIATRAAGRL